MRSGRSTEVIQKEIEDLFAELDGKVPTGALSSWRYPVLMAKTSIEIDRDIARQAAEILGTATLRDTVDASLRDVVDAKRRLELVGLLAEEGRFDFDTVGRAWGADE